MRQKSLSPEDVQYRSALEKMRCRSCTDENNKLLRSLVSSEHEADQNFTKVMFNSVSISTSCNKYRDKINEVGSLRVATASGQEVKDFYSIDTLTEKSVKRLLNISTKRRLKIFQVMNNNMIRDKTQKKLWSLYPDMC